MSFILLDNFLNEMYPKTPKKSDYNPCCQHKKNRVLSDNLCLYVCCKCGRVLKNEPNNQDFYDKYKTPNVVKTYINYTSKYRHLTRLQNWSNYSHSEVQLHKILTFIEEKIRYKYNNDIVDFSKIMFKRLYKDMSVRANIKKALIVYCIYSTSITFSKIISLDELFHLFNISIKNYNDLNKKLLENRLFYPPNIDEYLKYFDIDKNIIIIKYNNFLNINNSFNNKTILLGLIYFMAEQENKLEKKKYFDTFSISKGSIKNICIFIKDNKLINN